MTPLLTPLRVIAKFQEVTGIKIRVISHDMEAQAMDFVKHGFSLADLESVIWWTQSMIGTKAGFSALSLQWRVIFGRRGAGDEWQTFQDRLALSQHTVRLKPEPKAVTRHLRVDDGKIVNILDVAAEADIEPIRSATVSALSDLRKQMGA